MKTLVVSLRNIQKTLRNNNIAVLTNIDEQVTILTNILVQKCKPRNTANKNNGFIMFSPTDASTMSVLSTSRSISLIQKTSCMFVAKPVRTYKKQKVQTNMFYMKTCKTYTLLLSILVRTWLFDTQNPATTNFRAGSQMGTIIPLYYFDHGNQFQHSCWGKNSLNTYF